MIWTTRVERSSKRAEIEDGGVAGHAFSDIQFDWATAKGLALTG
jgi:hypothetical protein